MNDFNYEEQLGSVKPKRRRSWLIAPVLAIAAALAALLFGALGTFGDTDQVSQADAIDDGTIAMTATSSSTTLSNAAPGDSYYMFVSVANGGSLHARTAVTTESNRSGGTPQADDVLAAYLDIDGQWNGFNQSTCSGSANPNGATNAGQPNGTVVAVVGDVQAGADTGDEEIVAGTTENVCIRWNLPLTAPNEAQDGVVDINVNFHSEQVKNNG